MILYVIHKIHSSVLHRKVVIMAENKELKPKSFRIDDEVAEKFRQISVDIGGNQQETFERLIETFEASKKKGVLTNRKAEIDQFERHSTCLMNIYLRLLEEHQTAEETIRTDFEDSIKSKDTIIQDLQSQLTVAKQLKEEATLKAKAHANENEDLKQAIERLNKEYSSKMDDMQDMLKDKDSLNKALTSSCNNLKAKVEQMVAEEEQNKALHKELDSIKAEYDKLETTHKRLQADFSHEKTKYDQTITQMQKHENEAVERVKEQEQIKLDKTILELEKKHQEKLEKLKEDKQAEIDKYQQKYLSLLEQMEQSKLKKTSKTTKTEG